MADYNDLTYFHLQGLFSAITADTTGAFGDPGNEPDLFNVNMSATISYYLANSVNQLIPLPPMFPLRTATPPRTLMIVPVAAAVNSGVLMLPGAPDGVAGVEMVARSAVLEIPYDHQFVAEVKFGTASIGGVRYQFDPIMFVIPTVELADYHANVQQIITLEGSPAAGGWSLVYGDTPTATLPIATNAAALQAAMRAINAIGNAVTVTGGTGGVNCVQTVTIHGGTGVGHFTLQLLSQTTGPITCAPTTTAATVRTAIENLGYVNPGDVAVAGPNGGPWAITFQNGMGWGVVDPMIAFADSAMTADGGSVTVDLTTPGVNPGPYTATFDTTMIPRPLPLGSLDNLIGGRSPSVAVADTYSPTVIDLTTVTQFHPNA